MSSFLNELTKIRLKMLDLTIFAGQEDQCGSRSSLSLPALCKGGECSWPFHGDGVLNSGLPACTESTLPTEPSQSPSKHF